MQNKIKKRILILMILILVIIILTSNKFSKNIIFDDILIFGLWENNANQNEYEINLQNSIQIDIFKTIYNGNKSHKKIAPGSRGSFTIKIQKADNFDLKINVNENTKKPQNLVFIIDGKTYYWIEEAEDIINKKFNESEKITIDWEWKYETSKINDIQDTKDGQYAQKYIFEIDAIIEERTEV